VSEAPRWRQAFDAVDKAIAPHAESLVRTPGFSTGVALLRHAQVLARSTARDVTARAWHLLNLPAGSDVSRLRAQIGALDREVRRLTVQLEREQRKHEHRRPETEEAPDADRAQPAGGARPRPARRRTQRPAGA
jgi:hypothetical protein